MLIPLALLCMGEEELSCSSGPGVRSRGSYFRRLVSIDGASACYLRDLPVAWFPPAEDEDGNTRLSCKGVRS